MSKNKAKTKAENRAKRLLIAIVSAFIAIALGATCALWFGNSAKHVSVNGATGDVPTSATTPTTYNNKEGNVTGLALKKDDVFNYSYINNKVYNLTLPAGTYRLTVNGACGGGGYQNAAFSQGLGQGGQTAGDLTLTATTTLYIVVGGKGADGKINTWQASSIAAGGYNGGGNSGQETNSDKNDEGGGGGGATHIALVSGILRNLSSAANKDKVLIVGGGGGGTSFTRTAGKGYGGGGNGGVGYGGTAAPGGGTQTAGGAGGRSKEGTASNGTVGGFGYGGNGGSGTSGGGGGGGGWYGGGGAGVGGMGGGGSGYYKNTLKNTYVRNGGNTGNGTAQIKILNLPPKALATTPQVASTARGTSRGISIKANTVSTDPEGSNRYFTQGTASNLDTVPAANSGLYFNAACTSAVSRSYMDWSWSNNGDTLYINTIKRYPRNGYDGCTQNGRFTLYAKVRDAYGTNQTRGTAVVPFYVTVAEPAATKKGSATTVENVLGSKAVIGTTSSSQNSTAGLYNPSGNNRYTLTVKAPLKINEQITVTASELLKNLFNYTGTEAPNNDLVVMSVGSFAAATGSTRKFQILEYDGGVTGKNVTAYNAQNALIPNTYSQLTFKCLRPDSSYQVFGVTLYVVEKNTAYGKQNVVPGIAAVSLDIVFKLDNTRPTLKDTSTQAPVIELDALKTSTVDLNKYYQDNDTVNKRIDLTTHAIKGIKVATHEYVQLDKYGNLVSTLNNSGANKDKSYFNIMDASSAPASEVTAAMSTGMLSGSPTGFDPGLISTVASNTAYVQYSFSNATLNLTGLRATYDLYDSTRSGKNIATSGGTANGLSSAKSGALNAGHFYILINMQDKSDPSDAGIWLPLGIKVKNTAPTDLSKERGATGASVMPTASGKSGTSFLFTPMGITLNNTTYALGKYNNGSAYSNTDLHPLAADADNFFTENMLNGTAGADAGVLNELLTLNCTADAIRDSVTNNENGAYFTVELIDIFIPEAYFGNSANKYAGRVKTTGLEVRTGIDYNNDGHGINCVVIKGVKITLVGWTHNRYLHAQVPVKDSDTTGTTTVSIAVKVNNSAPDKLQEKDVALFKYESEGKRVENSYRIDDDGVATITYNMPMHSTAIVTPYDLLTDGNMTASGVQYPASGFTLNGLSGLFDENNGVFTVDGVKTAGDKRTTINALAIAQNEIVGGADYTHSDYVKALKQTLGEIKTTRNFGNSLLSASNSFAAVKESVKTTEIDRLYFERTNDNSYLDAYAFNPYKNDAQKFTQPAIIGDSFVTFKFGSTLKFQTDNNDEAQNTFNLDYIVITADSRTQANAPAVIELNVRDRTGAGSTGDANGVTKIRIEINVVNSSPRVQYPTNQDGSAKVYTLSTLPVGSADYPMNDATQGVGVTPSTLIIYAQKYTVNDELNKNFLVDNEKDPMSFYTAKSPRVYDKDGKDCSNYLKVTVNSDTLTITALNSTQHLQQVFVEFYATDGRSSDGQNIDYSTCVIQVEVENARLQYNHDEDGFTQTKFDPNDKTYMNLWSVQTLNKQDIEKPRDLASGDAAVTALKSDAAENATAGQIKTVVKDSDKLQGVVLAPVEHPEDDVDGNRKYKNADLTVTPIDYKSAVPYAALWSSVIPAYAAILIDIQQPSGHSGTVAQYVDSYDIIYYVDGNPYYASKLRDGTTVVADWTKFFDEHGRWKVTDWALKIVPKANSNADEYIRIRMMLRDDAAVGGGTAGMETAYKAGKASTVDGFAYMTYQMFINGLGIIPYNYYDQFDGYYTVADSQNSDVKYISTYDGTTDSVYSDAQNTLYLDGSKISVTGGATTLKTRARLSADNTLAGVHSGEVFVAGKNYEYPVKGNSGGAEVTIPNLTEKAFRYSDTIKVAGDKSYTYIPMSYFAMPASVVKSADNANGVIEYEVDNYVAYDIQGRAYARGNFDDIVEAITISDGSTVWGRGSNNPISANPYVMFTAFDAYEPGSGALNPSNDGYKGAASGEYFNNCFAISPIDDQGDALGCLTSADTTTVQKNANNLVGENGSLLYLADQATKIQENMFGIGIAKKNTRASSANLTITIAVAQCAYGSVGASTGTHTTYNDKSQTANVTFKLEIGNSPVSLVSGVSSDSKSGYFTSLQLKTGEAAQTIGLSRSGSKDADNTVNIKFDDDDKCVTNNVVDESKSDAAYFYADSMRKLGSWGVGGNAYSRVVNYTESGNDIVFTNTSDNAVAQQSMRNYFGTRNAQFTFNPADKNTIGTVDDTFKPNDGIYGSNMNAANGLEGYSSYFEASVSPDGKTLSIRPIAKTRINKQVLDKAATSPSFNITEFYNERGLEYDSAKGMGYYPLKVLIYDSHGDGFTAGSYVALEVRVYIETSAPSLASTLEDTDKEKPNGDKNIRVALPVGETYSLNIKDVIDSGDLLTKTGASDNGTPFWVTDYEEYLNNATALADKFKAESGTFLISPFSKESEYGWSETNNGNLRNGTAKITDKRIPVESQPDVVMQMEYNGDKLNDQSVPISSALTIRVNRRTTFDSQQYKEFTFAIKFTDNDKHTTQTLTITVEVTNKAPTIRSNAIAVSKNLNMRVGDSFTIVATPYDYFVGATNGNKDSAEASASYKRLNDSPKDIVERNLCKIQGDTDYGTSVKYSDLTASAVDANGAHALHSFDSEESKSQHLGYVAIADDDTPWALRIKDTQYDTNYFTPAHEYDRMPLEDDWNGNLYALDVVIVASRVCVNTPISVTVVDGNGASATFTMYVTVESSKPSVIMDGDKVHKRHEGLISTYKDGKEVAGVYETYMSVMSDGVKELNDVKVLDKSKSETQAQNIAHVYGELEIAINQIAYDPDEFDNAQIALFDGDGNGDEEYNIFTLNDSKMTKEQGNVYSNPMFRIDVASDLRSFKITCLTYNPDSDWDELKFYVRDVGNNIFKNAVPVTIRISTLYSAVTNDKQATSSSVENGALKPSVVGTTYVKPYDDYIGVSAAVKPLPDEQKEKIVGVKSTYQFVNYKDMPESVDQLPEKTYSLTDKDVVNNIYNRNYDVKVYALMERDADNPRKYNPLPLGSLASGVTSVSSLLDLNRNTLGAHYLNFKSDVNVSSYLVGGVNAGGSAIGGINNTLLTFLQQYFEFEIGADGTSLHFRPVTANIDMNVLFFVEVSKSLNSSRAISPYEVGTKSGTLFYVNVKDSAPIANTVESVLQFTGKKGDSHIFPIYSAENAYSAMFTDSDLNDSVIVKAFAPSGNLNEDYNTALKDADCDWQARTGVGRAIEVEVNNTDTTSASGIPAHSLKLTILRRIDKIVAGKYLNEVSFPMYITGYDKADQSATVQLNITVQNSDFDMSEDKLNNDSQKFNLFGEGYAMYKDEASERERSYVLDAYVAPDSEQLNVNVVADGWLDDPDYTDMSRDTDSFRLIQKTSGENSDKYLFNTPLTVRSDAGNENIAVVTPVFGKDENHFSGIKITAETSKRGVTGVAYMRILDRSGNDTVESTGIVITIRITVLNAPPTLLPNTEKSFSVIGHDDKVGTPIVIDVTKYVTDRNNDTLRLYSMLPIGTDDIHCTDTVDMGGNLVEVSVSEDDNGKCIITPRKGFYGTQKIQLTVADGDLSTDINARTVILEITVSVVYDFNQIAQLNRVSAIRSLPTKVTTEKLFPDITDTYNPNFYNENGDKAAVAADDEQKTFNPGSDYVITALTPNGANVTVDKDADGDWQFTCTREIEELTFSVELVSKLDYDFTVGAPKEGAQKLTKTFIATVGKNHAPTLLDNFKRESGFTFHTRPGDYGLDSNGTVALTTTMLFADVDLALGDRMVFDAKVTDVISPTMCSVRVSEDGTILYLTFNVRGETELTVGVKDRTGETVKATFVIKNIDRPEPSFMNMIKISYETYPFIWLGVGIGLLVLILFIILLIILLKRRKRKREELEAILVSEMELEEQMMRLAGGPAAAPYQSYGYLPPTMPVQNDPNLMLGAGGATPPQNNAIGLNPGAANDGANQQFGGDSGVSGDSDM